MNRVWPFQWNRNWSIWSDALHWLYHFQFSLSSILPFGPLTVLCPSPSLSASEAFSAACSRQEHWASLSSIKGLKMEWVIIVVPSLVWQQSYSQSWIQGFGKGAADMAEQGCDATYQLTKTKQDCWEVEPHKSDLISINTLYLMHFGP